MVDVGTCELCGRVAWAPHAHDGDRFVHPCCAIEIEQWGLARCVACEIAEAERRRWERRRGVAS